MAIPELPEIESLRRVLVRSLIGKTITKVIYPAVITRQFSSVVQANLASREIRDIDRYGKLLIFRLSGDVNLRAHLGMSGRFVLRPFGQRHDHFSWEFDGGSSHLTYNDFRRFGRIEFSVTDQAHDKLGPDALMPEFRTSTLTLRTRRPIKLVLMDQKIVAGLGNIYACEALFRARIDPVRATNTLSAGERIRLVRTIKRTLLLALEHGGSTLNDYRGTEGEAGDFDAQFLVYDRAGQACKRCGPKVSIIKRTLDGRATYYCRSCQS